MTPELLRADELRAEAAAAAEAARWLDARAARRGEDEAARRLEDALVELRRAKRRRERHERKAAKRGE